MFSKNNKKMETVPLYQTQISNTASLSSRTCCNIEDDYSSEDLEFIECGPSPPEEDTPNISSLEETSASDYTEEICASTIKYHLLEHMTASLGRRHLLDDIESNTIKQDTLEEAFRHATKTEINIAFLWTAFMKRWELLEGFLKINANLYYYEPNYGLGALHLVAFSGCIPGTQFLLAKGCNVNAIYKYYTPIHCAAFGDSPDTAMILINNGADIRALTNTTYTSNENVLHCAVRANAIACIRLFVHEMGDVNHMAFSGMSPLHLAAEMGRYQCLKILLESKNVNVNTQSKGKEQTMLHLAAENGYVECVDMLIEKGADANLQNHMSQTALHLAARAKAFYCVDLLLRKGNADPNIEDCDKRTPLHTAVGRTAVSSDIIDILIKHHANLNKKDQYGYTPLHIAALNGLSHCVEILILSGADVTAKSKCGMTPLRIIRRKIPASLQVITKKFDSAITLYQNPDSSSREADLRLDFRCILHHTHPREISYLNTFVDEGQKEFLLHPLCSAFLYLKWEKIRKYYIIRMLFCFVFVFNLSLYVLTALAHNCYNRGILNDTGSEPDNIIELCEKQSMMGHMLRTNPFVIETQWFLLVAITSFEIMRKLYGLTGYSTAKQYFSYPENTLEWLVIASVFVISFIYTGRTYTWQNHVGAFAVLFAWTNFMLMIGQLPIFGSYVAMYTRVQGEFAKLLLAYSSLLLGFTISFCVIFPDSSIFANPLIGFVSVIVMMSGELDLDILVNDSENPPYLLEVSAQVTFILFVLFITIILMNLLVGIAVEDIQGLKKTAGLTKLVRQTKLISHIELALFNGNLPQYFLNLLHWTALVSPKAYRVVLNVKPYNDREKRLPRDILEAAHEIAKKNQEMNQVLSFTSLEENNENLDYTNALTLLQNSLEKRDEQIDNLRTDIADLKNNFATCQKTLNQIIHILQNNKV